MSDLLDRWVRLWAAGMREVWREYTADQPALRIQGRALVGQTPARVVYAEGALRLLHYTPLAGPIRPIPVLCVPSLINQYYIMDLTPERSLVRYLLSRGLDVYMLNWGIATPADRYRSLDEYITGLLGRCVQRICEHTGRAAISLLGYCMGGLMSAVYAVLYPDRVANLVNLAGPVNYHDEGIYSTWTRPEWLNVDALVDTLGNIPPALLNLTFHLVRPTDELVQALNYQERRHDPAFLRVFAAMELWTNDPTPFPGEAFRKYIKDLYQQNLLVAGKFCIGGQRIDLPTLRVPTLTIAARRDHIAPWQSVAALHDLITSPDKTLIVLEKGHIGMVVGSDAPVTLWPRLGEWLAARSEGQGGD